MTGPATILLGIGGSIAAYKACDLIRLLREPGHRVIPVMTRAATRIIPTLTIGVLSGESVYVNPFDPKHNEGVDHIGLVQEADVYVIAPATANLIARLALGLGSDYPSLVALAFPQPWVVAPAMNTRMLMNPVVQGHLDTLRQRGARIVEPATGLLACGEVGAGKLATVEAIRDAVFETLATKSSLAGVRVLITAGGTREPVDAVRYIGNRSSGRMGFAMAEAAAQRGAQVTLISTIAPPAMPDNVSVILVETAAQMGAALAAQAPSQDIVVMAAAVSDYTLQPREGKMHRSETGAITLDLTPTADLLANLVRTRPPGQTIVGFAAEVGDLATRAREKYLRKGCDLVVANDVSQAGIGFGSPDNAVLVISGPDPSDDIALTRAPKPQIARQLWELILQQRARGSVRSQGALHAAAS